MLRDVMHNIQVVESYLLKSPHTNGGTSVPFSFKNKINVIFTRVLAICGILVWSWALHPHFIQQIQLLRSLRSKIHFSFWSLPGFPRLFDSPCVCFVPVIRPCAFCYCPETPPSAFSRPMHLFTIICFTWIVFTCIYHLFPILPLICCLICFSCALLIPLVGFTCVFSLFPLLYIDLCFCSSLSDRNSLSVRIYARILHFSE